MKRGDKPVVIVNEKYTVGMYDPTRKVIDFGEIYINDFPRSPKKVTTILIHAKFMILKSDTQ